MTDETFLARFEAASLHSFDHRDHLRVAFAYARRGGIEHAVARAREGLRRFAAAHGEPGRYHETLTTAWARVVGHYALQRARRRLRRLPGRPPAAARARPALRPLQPRAAVQRRRRGRRFVEPDLLALP